MARAAAALAPDAGTTALPGIGPRTAEHLAAAGIRTVADLLRCFPRRCDVVQELARPDASACGRLVRVTAAVERATRAFLPGRRSVVTVHLTSDGVPVEARFFNQPWMHSALPRGTVRTLEGRLAESRHGFVLEAPRLVPKQAGPSGACVVRYPAIAGVPDARLRAAIAAALDAVPLADGLFPPLPEGLAERCAVPDRAASAGARDPAAFARDCAAALRAMHRPRDAAEHEAARRWFALAEAVATFRIVESARRRRARRPAPRIPAAAPPDAPWPWTPDQGRVLRALARRLARPPATAVLLQGDVGTGKTAVALATALRVARSGWQVACLAPTELLAEQLAGAARGWFDRAGIASALFTASVPPKVRRDLGRRLAEGALPVVVGTHALLSAPVRFARLGLLVVDEQQRFGVEQRAALAEREPAPHVLVMSATPIPRTLAFTLFGDLEVMTLRDRPAGRPVPRAVFAPRDRWPRVLQAIDRHVRRGGRVYVVCPHIGAAGDAGGTVRLHAALQRRFRCGLVHGRLPPSAARESLAAFRAGAFDVLVGTTIVEVGIDVPEATLIVVVGAERFGVATLHQLRGRVGRGSRRGLCILTGEATERVRAVCATTDGFELAEHDLRLRGAGELAGVVQSGKGDFRALDPYEDRALLIRARRAVRNEAADAAGVER